MSRAAIALIWTTVAAALATAVPMALARPHPPGPAAILVHRVEPGDTLALLAAEYYGDRRHQVLIAVANELRDDQPLAPGTKLRIPIHQEVVTDVGDTLDDLARRYLGDARRARFLAGFSANLPAELPSDAPIAAGRRIRVPLHVRHTVAADEPLAAVAATYFGNAEKARLLREYNFLGDEAPEAGLELLVPIHHVTVQRSRLPALDEASRQRMARRAEMARRAPAALAGARAAWDTGDYERVRRLLAEVDTGYLDAALALDIAVLLGSAHVAFGDEELAVEAFLQALARQPDHELDPYRFSPKIRAVWEQAGGVVGSER